MMHHIYGQNLYTQPLLPNNNIGKYQDSKPKIITNKKSMIDNNNNNNKIEDNNQYDEETITEKSSGSLKPTSLPSNQVYKTRKLKKVLNMFYIRF